MKKISHDSYKSINRKRVFVMSDVLSEILRDVPIPKMVRVRQRQAEESLPPERIPEAVEALFTQRGFGDAVRPGMRIAITAGSRGIANIALIVKSIASSVKARGGLPFVAPAMGSHGGATAAGQAEVLAHYGITEEACGCPVRSSLEVKTVARDGGGRPVMIDRLAAESDGIIVAARIKPHTNFVGAYESGLLKMMVIGLGNHLGAQAGHAMGIENFPEVLPDWGKRILENAPVLFGVAILDNTVHETAELVGVLPEDFLDREPQLLARARELMPRLYFRDYHVLVVDRIGKDISGSGMDPHVSGSFNTEYMRKNSGVYRARNIAVLDLTDESGHNGYGVGDADVTTRRLWDKVDLEISYPNAVISNCLCSAKIPVIMANDRLAIQACLKCCVGVDPAKAGLVRILDTLHVKDVLISESLLPQAEALDEVTVLGPAFPMEFDANGNLLTGFSD